jgi:hypothetical protein
MEMQMRSEVLVDLALKHLYHKGHVLYNSKLLAACWQQSIWIFSSQIQHFSKAEHYCMTRLDRCHLFQLFHQPQLVDTQSHRKWHYRIGFGHWVLHWFLAGLIVYEVYDISLVLHSWGVTIEPAVANQWELWRTTVLEYNQLHSGHFQSWSQLSRFLKSVYIILHCNRGMWYDLQKVLYMPYKNSDTCWLPLRLY